MSSDPRSKPSADSEDWARPLLDWLAPRATPSIIGYLFALLLLFSFGLFPARSVALAQACVWQQERSTILLASELARGMCRGDRLVLDVRRWYTPEETRGVLDALGTAGRSIYVCSQLLFDYAFPIVYSLFFVLVLVRLCSLLPMPPGGGASRRLVWRWAPLLPLVGGAADLFENTLLVVIAWRFDGAAPALASVAAPFTFVKRGLFEVATLLVLSLTLWIVVRRLLAAGAVRVVGLVCGFLGVLVRYLMLVRVPLLVAGFLLALGVLGRGSFATVENLMLMETPGQLAVLLFLALQTGGTVGLTALVAWENAPQRFGVAPWPLPGWLANPGVARTLWFAPLGSPLVAAAAMSSMAPPNGPLRARAVLGGLAIGLALGLTAAGGIELLRRAIRGAVAGGPVVLRALVRPIAARAQQLARLLGAGYWDATAKRIVPGHALAGVADVMLLALYALGFVLLHPDNPGGLFDHYPTIAFVLVITLIVCISLAGAAFFFDAFRFPLLLALGLWLAAMSAIGGRWGSRHHAFDVALLSRAEMPSPLAAASARLSPFELPAPMAAPPPAAGKTLTNVTLGGGGIQAAAWGAEVLAGLHQALGPEWTRSVALLSSVSGGSTAAHLFLEVFDPETGLPSSASLEPLRRAAAASSLEATAWGLAYPDLLRAATFLRLSPARDRGWAMERAWLHSAAAMKRAVAAAGGTTWSAAGDAVRLADWARGARDGTLPAVIMNATFVEDAQQAWITNLDLSALDPPAPPAAASSSVPGVGQSKFGAAPRIEDPSLRYHYDVARAVSGNAQPLDRFALDLDVVTAARLSATFPWVTPVARARLAGLRLPAYHLADGGYFDNYGTVAALDWLIELLDPRRGDDRPAAEQEERARLRAAVERILFVDVRAFPTQPRARPRDDRGLAFASAAPLQTIVGVRTSTQARRGNLELELLARIPQLDAQLHQLVLQPPSLEGRRDPPLSWHLSASDKRQVCFDWMRQESAVEAIRSWFPDAPWNWPTASDCDRRLAWRR